MWSLPRTRQIQWHFNHTHCQRYHCRRTLCSYLGRGSHDRSNCWHSGLFLCFLVPTLSGKRLDTRYTRHYFTLLTFIHRRNQWNWLLMSGWYFPLSISSQLQNDNETKTILKVMWELNFSRYHLDKFIQSWGILKCRNLCLLKTFLYEVKAKLVADPILWNSYLVLCTNTRRGVLPAPIYSHIGRIGLNGR